MIYFIQVICKQIRQNNIQILPRTFHSNIFSQYVVNGGFNRVIVMLTSNSIKLLEKIYCMQNILDKMFNVFLLTELYFFTYLHRDSNVINGFG